MPEVLHIGLRGDDKIARFGIDAGSGKLTPKAESPVAGAPVFAAMPDRPICSVGSCGASVIESRGIGSAGVRLHHEHPEARA